MTNKEDECNCGFAQRKAHWHSLECSIFDAANKIAQAAPTSEWEKEAGEVFAGEWNEGDLIKEKVYSFISNLLSSQISELKKAVEGMREGYATAHNEERFAEESAKKGYNQALDTVLALLDKGEET